MRTKYREFTGHDDDIINSNTGGSTDGIEEHNRRSTSPAGSDRKRRHSRDRSASSESKRKEGICFAFCFAKVCCFCL